MSPIRKAVDEYLALRRGLGFKLCQEGLCSSGSPRLCSRDEANASRRRWHSNGRRSRHTLGPRTWRAGSALCAPSHSTARPATLGPKCRRLDYCHTATAASRRTSTPTTRLDASSKPRGSSNRRRDCVHGPTARCSVCWSSPGCASAKSWGLSAMTSISRRPYSPFAGPNSASRESSLCMLLPDRHASGMRIGEIGSCRDRPQQASSSAITAAA